MNERKHFVAPARERHGVTAAVRVAAVSEVTQRAPSAVEPPEPVADRLVPEEDDRLRARLLELGEHRLLARGIGEGLWHRREIDGRKPESPRSRRVLAEDRDRDVRLLQIDLRDRRRLSHQRPRFVRVARGGALEQRIATAEVVRSPDSLELRVRFGATVTVSGADGERRYEIVGVDEADPARGKLAFTSPLARALLGRAEGDTVSLRTPRGLEEVEISGVAYGE